MSDRNENMSDSDSDSDREKKIAIVLAGGATRGAFQVGVLQKLFLEDIVPDEIYGTSIGAINASLCASVGPFELEKIWMNSLKRRKIYKFNLSTLFWMSKGIFNLKPLIRLLNKSIKNPERYAKATVCLVDLPSGRILYKKSNCADKKKWAKFVASSAAIPILFSPIDNHVDGGVRENAPLRRAIDDGADEIHIILCHPFKEEDIRPWTLDCLILPSVSIGMRSMELIMHEILINDIHQCHTYNRLPDKKKIDLFVYAPGRKLSLGTLELDKDKIQRVIRYGATMQPIRM